MVRVPANLCLQSQAKSAVLEKCPDGVSVIPIRRGWLTLGSPLQPGEYFFVLHGVSRDPFPSKRCQRLRPRAISLKWSQLLPGHWHREKRPGTRNRVVSYFPTPSPG
jgi:hypothetical protein